MKEDAIIEQALSILETRMRKPEHYLNSPQDTKSYLKLQFEGAKAESFRVMFLDSQHGLIDCKEMFTGTIDGAAVYPREIVRQTLECNAAAVVFAHNHPSGICEPSVSDRQLTERLTQALKLIDVRVLDHIIVGGARSVSFAERGIMP